MVILGGSNCPSPNRGSTMIPKVLARRILLQFTTTLFLLFGSIAVPVAAQPKLPPPKTEVVTPAQLKAKIAAIITDTKLSTEEKAIAVKAEVAKAVDADKGNAAALTTAAVTAAPELAADITTAAVSAAPAAAAAITAAAVKAAPDQAAAITTAAVTAAPEQAGAITTAAIAAAPPTRVVAVQQAATTAAAAVNSAVNSAVISVQTAIAAATASGIK